VTSAAHPPRPGLTLRVGVTGHRDLKPAAAARLAPRVEALLAGLAAEARRVLATHADVYAPADARLFLLSQLAKGADQLSARAGLALGYQLRTVLPFPAAEFRAGFEAEDGAAFDELLAQSAHVWVLPGTPGEPERGYALAGESTVAQCDILLAIWDGQAARGHGGTADVVEYAIRRGVPVLHLPASGVGEGVALWSAFGGLTPDRLDRHSAPRRPLTEAAAAQIVQALLAPPSPAPERAALARYLAERRPRLRLRPEYPLLLAITGVRGLRRRNLISADYETVAEAEWKSFFDQPTAGAAPVRAGLATLQQAFAWSDGLADHFAQIYRSASIFNYAAAAVSVLLALTGVLAPAAKAWLVAGELLAIGLVIANTALGGRGEWHRRWLDYRLVAEQLRPMRSLSLLGAASPLRVVHGLDGAGWRWTDWYAAAIWRDLGAPPTIPGGEGLAALVAHLSDQEVTQQVAYNRANAHRMHQLDHRLHLAGTALFYATAGVGALTLTGLMLDVEAIHTQARLATVLAAGLPTVGGALFGIRGQGDFIGASGRSAETADKLQAIGEQLAERPVDLARACRALENAAQIMLADLGEWRVSYRHRKLAIPA
jgi:hypothetical protein